MHTLLVIGFCLSGIVFGSVATATLRTEGREIARLKRQFETTCAFYRWSHCPGKKEVENSDEGKVTANVQKEINYLDSDEYLNKFSNEEENKTAKASRIAKQRLLRKLFSLLFPKRKMKN